MLMRVMSLSGHYHSIVIALIYHDHAIVMTLSWHIGQNNIMGISLSYQRHIIIMWGSLHFQVMVISWSCYKNQNTCLPSQLPNEFGPYIRDGMILSKTHDVHVKVTAQLRHGHFMVMLYQLQYLYVRPLWYGHDRTMRWIWNTWCDDRMTMALP